MNPSLPDSQQLLWAWVSILNTANKREMRLTPTRTTTRALGKAEMENVSTVLVLFGQLARDLIRDLSNSLDAAHFQHLRKTNEQNPSGVQLVTWRVKVLVYTWTILLTQVCLSD